LWNDTAIEHLKRDLLKGYDRFIRPEVHNKAIKLQIALTLIHIDLDETRGVLTTHGWLKMNWTDRKLSWDNRSYDGIKDLHVSADEVSSSGHESGELLRVTVLCHYRFGNLIFRSTTAPSPELLTISQKQTKLFTLMAAFYG